MSEGPELNRTQYTAVQQETDSSLLSNQTVLLSTDDWRGELSTSELADETRQFLDATDFGSSYVVGFEVQVTEWGYYLRLNSVETKSDQIRVEYADVFVEGGPNVEQWRAMFLRLPRDGSVPASVALVRTDERE